MKPLHYILLSLAVLACRPNSHATVRQRVVRPASIADNGIIAIQVRPTDSFRFTRLNIRLTNLSGSPLSLTRISLPWGSPYSLALKAFDTHGKELPLASSIFDPAPSPSIVLPPGASLEGAFDLGWRVIGIEEALARGPVRVNWAYPSSTLPGFLVPANIGPGIGGTIVLAPASLDPSAV